MNIVLMGGNGYIGREVTRQWLARDPKAQFYVMSKSGKNQLENPRITNLQADCYDEKAVETVLPSQVDAIADFVGGMGGHDVNVPPAQVMLDVANRHNIPMMGFVGGKLGNKGFTSSKAEAAKLLRTSGRPVAIVEPTLVYGAGRSDSLTKMVPLLKFFGIFSKNMRPVRVEDVARQLIDGMTGTSANAGPAATK